MNESRGALEKTGALSADVEQLRADNASLREANARYRRHVEQSASTDDQVAQLVLELQDTHAQLESRVADRVADLRQANEQLQAEIAERKRVERKVGRLNREIEEQQRDIIFKLAEIVEARSKETGTHVMRVAELSSLLAVKCGLGDKETELIRLAAPMHDVGKVGVPDSILLNPGRLSDDEFEIMKTHTTSGYEMLKGSDRQILKTAAIVALQHHEKFNGSGYPMGLKGEQIHLLGRITCIADVFDALSSDRVYRKAWELDRILDYFRRQRGESFDPYLIDLFMTDLADFVAVRDSSSSSDGDILPDLPSMGCPLPIIVNTANLETAESQPAGSKISLPVHSLKTSEQADRAAHGDADNAQRSDRIRRILVADDEENSRNMLERILNKSGYDVAMAADGDDAWKIIQGDEPPKLAFVSHSMPGKNGTELCRMIRRLKGAYVYVILLTHKDRERELAEGMSAGADVCIRKPLEEEEIRARLRAAERILDLQSELIATQESLLEQATHDALTGLWNRRATIKILRTELDRARREDTSLGVIMADLDKFKNINDTYGHRGGDQSLQEAAQRMRTVMRPYDMVGRYGGEEFLIIVPRCDHTFAGYVAERLRAAIADEPVRADNQEFPLTVSLGVTAGRSIEDTDGNTLIHVADQALYEAKRNGRNRVVITDLQSADL